MTCARQDQSQLQASSSQASPAAHQILAYEALLETAALTYPEIQVTAHQVRPQQGCMIVAPAVMRQAFGHGVECPTHFTMLEHAV